MAKSSTRRSFLRGTAGAAPVEVHTVEVRRLRVDVPEVGGRDATAPEADRVRRRVAEVDPTELTVVEKQLAEIARLSFQLGELPARDISR